MNVLIHLPTVFRFRRFLHRQRTSGTIHSKVKLIKNQLTGKLFLYNTKIFTKGFQCWWKLQCRNVMFVYLSKVGCHGNNHMAMNVPKLTYNTGVYQTNKLLINLNDCKNKTDFILKGKILKVFKHYLLKFGVNIICKTKTNWISNLIFYALFSILFENIYLNTLYMAL